MIHEFICDACGTVTEDTHTHKVHKCPKCGGNMRWDLIQAGGSRGDYNHYSESLAINPDQIPEHRETFPGVDVLPDGIIHFTSVKQQSNYEDKCGFYKHTKKIKSGKIL